MQIATRGESRRIASQKVRFLPKKIPKAGHVRRPWTLPECRKLFQAIEFRPNSRIVVVKRQILPQQAVVVAQSFRKTRRLGIQ